MRKLTFLFLTTFLLTNSYSQITKRNWMVGGNGTFSSTKTESSSINAGTRNYFRIAPNIGYFFIDKLASGIAGVVNHEKTSAGSISDKQTYYSVGPFIRYYFLPSENQINIFSEGNYQHFILNPGNESSNSYTFMLGAVVFFNSSVGLELTGGYSITNYDKSDIKYKIFQLGLGLQIHLEKEQPH
jgi:hypothetical protein